MTYEFIVLFGGSLVLISLRRKRVKHSKKRTPNTLKFISTLIEVTVLIVGLSTFMYGIIHVLR